MDLTKKTTDALALVAVSSAAFMNLHGLPIFADEGAQVWWVERVVRAGDWTRSLGYGRPLEAWLAVPFVLLGAHTLTVMRVLHVISGIVSVLLVYWLATHITTRRAAFVAALLTATCPFIVFFQRLALSEMYLCAAGLLVLVTMEGLWRRRTWGWALLLAVSLVLAALAKLPVGFIFIASVFLALIFMSKKERTGLSMSGAWLKLAAALAPVVVLSCAVVAVATIRMSQGKIPGFGLVDLMQKTGSTNRIGTVLANLPKVYHCLVDPLTLPVVMVGALGVLWCLLKGSGGQRWVAAMGVLPVLSIVVASSFWYCRYLTFALPMLIIAAVCGWQSLLKPCGKLKTALASVLAVLCVILMGYNAAVIIAEPAEVRGMEEYSAGAYSGYAFVEMADYLLSLSEPPCVIYTRETPCAAQLREYLPPAWAAQVQQLHVVGAATLDSEEQQAYVLERTSACLLSRIALAEKDAFVAAHLRRVVAFRHRLSDDDLVLYEVVK